MKVDVETIEQLKKGYESAFDKIYAAYEKSIYFLILSIVKNEEAAKDLLQETFIKIYLEVHALRNSETFQMWISKVAKNLAFNYLKSNGKYCELTPADILTISMENHKERCDYYFFNILSDTDNIILTYHIIQGLTFKEIGTILHKTTTCVAKKYYNIINKLKKSLLNGN